MVYTTFGITTSFQVRGPFIAPYCLCLIVCVLNAIQRANILCALVIKVHNNTKNSIYIKCDFYLKVLEAKGLFSCLGVQVRIKKGLSDTNKFLTLSC